MSELESRTALPRAGRSWLALQAGFVLGIALHPAWARAEDYSRATHPETAASAGPDDEVLKANRSFQLGRQALAEGRTLDACQQFDQSRRHFPSPATLLNLGDCYERGDLEGGFPDALQMFQLALREAENVTLQRTRELVTKEAQRRVDQTRARMAHVTLMPSVTPDASVLLNGLLIRQLDTALTLYPGNYRIEVSAPKKQRHVQEFAVTEAQALEIALPELLDEQPTGPMIQKESPATTTPHHESRFGTLPYWLWGAAAVLGGAWLYTGLMSSAKDQQYGKLWVQCSATPCDDSTIDRAKTAQRSAKSYAVATDFAVIPAFAVTLSSAFALWWLDDFVLPGSSEVANDTASNTQLGCSSKSCLLQYAHSF